MDFPALRRETLSSNTSAREKAQMFVHICELFHLSKDEWRQLIAGVPVDVGQELIVLTRASIPYITDSTGQQLAWQQLLAQMVHSVCPLFHAYWSGDCHTSGNHKSIQPAPLHVQSLKYEFCYVRMNAAVVRCCCHLMIHSM